MKKLWFLLLVALGCVLLNGCGPTTDSTNVLTSGLYAVFQVEQNPDNTVFATAQLRVGGAFGTKLHLTSNEHLSCNGVEMPDGLNDIHSVSFGTPP